jgi:topoisomerase-4 subunit A
MVAAMVVDSRQELVLHAGKRHIAIPYRDLEHYRGERGRRGNKLPRGLQKVERAEVRG